MCQRSPSSVLLTSEYAKVCSWRVVLVNYCKKDQASERAMINYLYMKAVATNDIHTDIVAVKVDVALHMRQWNDGCWNLSGAG